MIRGRGDNPEQADPWPVGFWPQVQKLLIRRLGQEITAQLVVEVRDEIAIVIQHFQAKGHLKPHVRVEIVIDRLQHPPIRLEIVDEVDRPNEALFLTG
jgi:hypothetical protein